MEPTELIQTNYSDPFSLFETLYKQAETQGESFHNAMTLATSSPEGRPSARVVLLRGLSRDGLVFYTNYESRKAKDLEENPLCALVFYWKVFQVQVRIEGEAEKLPREDSESYFQKRPRGSQISAWISPQSQPIESRQELEKRYQEYEKQHVEQTISCPEFWGGYRVLPEQFEFWVERPDRLHDRVLFEWKQNKWQRRLLAP